MGDSALGDGGVAEEAEAETHVDPVQLLGEADAHFSEPVMFPRRVFDVVLVESDMRQFCCLIYSGFDNRKRERRGLTAIGFESVRMTSEPSLKVNDIGVGGTVAECLLQTGV